MTLLDCAKLSDFVLVKSPRFATIQQEGHKALIVYCNSGRDWEVMRVKNPLVQATKSTRCCLDTRCKFPLHGAVTADIAAEVLEASNVGQFGTIRKELSRIANNLCFGSVDAKTHSFSDVIVGG